MTADKRRIAACLKACEGISTQNLEDNVPVLELALRYNAVLRERDALRAKIAEMEKQEPVAKVTRNAAGQIRLEDAQGNAFDLFENLGATLYALPGAKGE